MSGDPKAPAAPDSTFPLPAQEPPRFAGPAAPTAPGIPSVMPSASGPMPASGPFPPQAMFPAQAAPAMYAAPFAAPAYPPAQVYPAQPAYAAPAMPAQPAYAAPAMPTPAMPAAPAAPAASATAPVLGVRDFYRFAEEPVGQRVQITILETPAMPPELPPPSKIDPGLEATRVALEAQLAGSAIAALPYVPPTATRWFRFSPLELFMEQVLARRLWTVE